MSHLLLAALCVTPFLPGCGANEKPLPGGEFELVHTPTPNPGESGSSATSSSAPTSAVTGSTGTAPESSNSDTSSPSADASSPTSSAATNPASDTTAQPKAPHPAQQHYAIRIDLAKNSVDLIKSKKVQQTVSFKRRAKRGWEDACPKQYHSDLLEVVDLEIPQITFAGLTIPKPVLTSSCFSADDEVYMRSADPRSKAAVNLEFVRPVAERPLVPAQ